MKKAAITIGLLALLGGLVYAGTTIKPFRASGGIQMVPTGNWNGQPDMGGIFYKADGGIMAHNPDGTNTLLGAGGTTFPIQNGSSSVTFNYGGTQTGSSTDFSSRATNAATTGDKLWSWGDTAEAVSLKLAFAAGWDFTSATANIGLLNNNGDGIRAQGANHVFWYGAGAAQLDFFANNSVTPQTAITWGTGATPFSETYSKRYGTATQAIAAATNLTVGSVNGDHIRLSLSATAISTLTVNAGVAGETLTIEVIQDGTGGRTIPTTWTNVVFAGGTYTATATANKRDVISLIYDATATKWYESARAMNL